MSLAPLKELLVASVVQAHPMHGYALAETLEGGLGPSLGLTRPTIYAILRRLEARGWIEAGHEREGNRPERAVYRLTGPGEVGLQALAAEVASRAPPALAPLGVQLALFDGLDPDTRHEALAKLHERRARRLAELEALVPGHEGYAGAALELLCAQARLEVDTLARLLGGAPPG